MNIQTPFENHILDLITVITAVKTVKTGATEPQAWMDE